MTSEQAPDAAVAVVVVTYNRLALLQRCVASLQAQTRAPHLELVIDNASTDGTQEHFITHRVTGLRYLRLPQNLGGAGGFAAGLQAAIESGAEWIWMMDDDAEPHATALEELMKVAEDSASIYGSTAVNGLDTAWVVTTLDGPTKTELRTAAGVPARATVESLPFLGFLVHRELVEKIGLPDAGYFIAADDIEYCLRAQRAGAKLFIAGQSRIEHPKSAVRYLQFLGRRIAYLSLPPWKRYYDTRNRLLNARKYSGIRLVTQVIPASVVRAVAAVYFEPRKLAQLWACCTGMFDGVFGIKGKRHASWGIRQ